jgi:aspartate aminotransferase
MNSQFNNVKSLAPDAIFHTNSRFLGDNDPRKINLGIGAYRTEEGKPYVLKIVKEVEEEILNDKTLNKEYLPIGGDSEFIRASQENILGKCRALQEERVAGVQTLSGTGALCICANFIRKFS